jgi:hypothetical protein
MYYNLLLKEVWTHCQNFSDTPKINRDVCSVKNLTTYIPVTIALHANTTQRSYDRLVVDTTVDDNSHTTAYGKPYLYNINMAKWNVTEQCDMTRL